MTHNTHDLTANKLIILFLLRNVSAPITQTQLTDFILFNNYTDYFSLQQYLAELVNANLINSNKVEQVTYYSISSKGNDILDLFINRIPFSIREEIIEYTKNNECKINFYTKIEATIKENNNQYNVNCSIKENENIIISLTIITESEDEAKRVKMNWQKQAKSIYKTIIKDLKKSK